MLDIVASYHGIQCQRELMIQTQENGEKPHFGPDFWAQWSEIRTDKFFKKIWLRQSLDIMVNYHHAKYQDKLKIQSWENLVKDGQTDGRTRVNS